MSMGARLIGEPELWRVVDELLRRAAVDHAFGEALRDVLLDMAGSRTAGWQATELKVEHLPVEGRGGFRGAPALWAILRREHYAGTSSGWELVAQAEGEPGRILLEYLVRLFGEGARVADGSPVPPGAASSAGARHGATYAERREQARLAAIEQAVEPIRDWYQGGPEYPERDVVDVVRDVVTDLQHDRAEALALGNELDRVTRNLQIILDRSRCSCPAEEGQKPRRRGLCGWCKVSELREDMLRVRARDRRRP